MSDAPVRMKSVELLSDNWGTLKKYSYDFLRRDGRKEPHTREVYDRGNGAVVLPYDPERNTVLLTRQFRLPAFVTGHTPMLIEACAGLLDDNDAETTARKETEEELGYRLRHIERVFDVFMSPGSVTERLVFFVAAYNASDRISDGGGHEGEGEDIEVLEMTLDHALSLVRKSEIVDAKTIMLLQHLKLNGLTG
ncbi:NUDIX domain-containing protein [Phyllobacterium endophyticum]|uniref:GDP-mannose pyrophosphatase n=1 Tax=Phyllobacterium endophyticum TaxID=1149773 RepID=A0A2P7APL1_9HYPH|nr:NUDIX domain-containing protein [Phyllobacterium endophyticum]MBB3233448.1 nudix-type nucleoside diphosphatase (YffH/AdpP family) [Phyllobacterium endophyticum]PSH56152.1 GDP-mannose pyrophosphatase [Phyllobacterium endophyticum]TXR47455.1 NUDIX domain-containing protein [Phyllobacterium endophyticum]TYR41318.1 NUDIX domain-containing protein [Phyllobacterium endophyticum]